MIPKRYLIATLFIAAMLVILAVVQAPRSTREGGVGVPGDSTALGLTLDSFEKLAEYRLEDGWSLRFQGNQDPDQSEAWPSVGGFETPWEPASPYLGNQGLAINGPGGRSEVVFYRGLEWRHYRFDVPLCSARLDPLKGNRLLVTLALGHSRFETRLMEIPEGRTIWVSDSGPWSRFSWDGRAVITGIPAPSPRKALLLTALPTEGDFRPPTLAPWDEKQLPLPPKDWILKPEQLWDDGKDLPGSRVLVPWQAGDRLWFPFLDRLWVSGAEGWTLWALQQDGWHRADAGSGVLSAHPPVVMGRVSLDLEDQAMRSFSPLNLAKWEVVPTNQDPWPAYDPAWYWTDRGALTPWDQRWGSFGETLPPERQREALAKAYRSEWRLASGLRASVRGWLPQGPEVALRESQSVAWVWVGDRVLLVRLPSMERLRKIKAMLKGM